LVSPGIWGSGSRDIWVVGSNGIDHWDSGRWTAVASDPRLASLPMLAVWGSGPGEVWAITQSNVGFQWDGQAWSEPLRNQLRNLRKPTRRCPDPRGVSGPCGLA
jgi:hypothetical protein